jgi:hypothetical protein
VKKRTAWASLGLRSGGCRGRAGGLGVRLAGPVHGCSTQGMARALSVRGAVRRARRRSCRRRSCAVRGGVGPARGRAAQSGVPGAGRGGSMGGPPSGARGAEWQGGGERR